MPPLTWPVDPRSVPRPYLFCVVWGQFFSHKSPSLAQQSHHTCFRVNNSQFSDHSPKLEIIMKFCIALILLLAATTGWSSPANRQQSGSDLANQLTAAFSQELSNLMQTLNQTGQNLPQTGQVFTAAVARAPRPSIPVLPPAGGGFGISYLFRMLFRFIFRFMGFPL